MVGGRAAGDGLAGRVGGGLPAARPGRRCGRPGWPGPGRARTPARPGRRGPRPGWRRPSSSDDDTPSHTTSTARLPGSAAPAIAAASSLRWCRTPRSLTDASQACGCSTRWSRARARLGPARRAVAVGVDRPAALRAGAVRASVGRSVRWRGCGSAAASARARARRRRPRRTARRRRRPCRRRGRPPHRKVQRRAWFAWSTSCTRSSRSCGQPGQVPVGGLQPVAQLALLRRRGRRSARRARRPFSSTSRSAVS